MLLTLMLTACRALPEADTGLEAPPWEREVGRGLLGLPEPADSPVEESAPPTLEGLCLSGGTQDRELPRLWAASDDVLLWVREDGRAEVGWRFQRPEGLPRVLDREVAAMARGGFIGALARWRAYDSQHGSRYASALVLMDRLGAPLATAEGGGSGARLHLGDDGALVYDRGLADVVDGGGRLGGLVLFPDGRTLDLGPQTPLGPPRADGWLPACGEGRCAWRALADGAEREPWDGDPDAVLALAGRVVQLEDGGATLVLREPGAAWRFPLAFAEPGAVELLDWQEEGWVLVGRNPALLGEPAPGELLLLDVHAATLTPLALALPPGEVVHVAPTCPVPAAAVDSRGELDVLTRGEAGFTLWHVARGAWTPSLAGVGGVAGLWTLENAGTVQVMASSGAAAACSVVEGDGAEAWSALRGGGEALRLPLEVPGAWPPQPRSVSHDGRCVVVEDADGVRIEDLEGGAVSLPVEALGWRWL